MSEQNSTKYIKMTIMAKTTIKGIYFPLIVLSKNDSAEKILSDHSAVLFYSQNKYKNNLDIKEITKDEFRKIQNSSIYSEHQKYLKIAQAKGLLKALRENQFVRLIEKYSVILPGYNYYIVNCNCGYVGKGKAIPVDFPICAKNELEAKEQANTLPRVKKNADKLDKAVNSTKVVKAKKFFTQYKDNNLNMYLLIHSAEEQEEIMETLEDLIKEIPKWKLSKSRRLKDRDKIKAGIIERTDYPKKRAIPYKRNKHFVLDDY